MPWSQNLCRVSLVTALAPIGKWLWTRYLVRRFDAKRDHHNELIAEAQWFESRAVKLDALRIQLLYEKPADRFKLAGIISKLDQRDAQWARTVEDMQTLADSCKQKQEECQDNARQCRQFADDVARKVLFW
jgi:hypothetical protein